jgi:diketogulonate reductase-like aldo/keto reductase
MSKIPLNDGFDMPSLGLVSFRRDTVKEVRDVVTTCMELGIKHYEISDLYGNANVVVDSILDHDVQREELFLTMKAKYFYRDVYLK